MRLRRGPDPAQTNTRPLKQINASTMQRSIPFFFLVLALLLPVGTAAGQAIVSGTVTDAETGEGISDAHVFIAESMNGSITSEVGAYRLNGVALGSLRLYVSVVGYEPQAMDLFIRRPGEHTYDFELQPSVTELGEVEVVAERDARWERRLEKFIRLFIGETPFAAQTEIVNPEVLDFTDRVGRFTARAAETLVIENRALGYRIQYFLKEFEATGTRTSYDGEPLFEEMRPSTPEEAAHWKRNRDDAFNGSLRHFLLALLDDRVEEEGFMIFQRPASRGGVAAMPTPGNGRFPIDRDEILKASDDPQERILDVQGFLEIVYTQETEDEAYLAWRGERGRAKYRTSMLLLENGPTVVDLKGDVADPYGVTQFGYLAFERVADDVPREYRPVR
ncbi:MAG: carboxypeptidase-like regulatory domain-containing protein [Rhodothermales bacterium]